MDLCCPKYLCPIPAPAGWDVAELGQGLPLAPLQHPLKKKINLKFVLWPTELARVSPIPRGFQGESHYFIIELIFVDALCKSCHGSLPAHLSWLENRGLGWGKSEAGLWCHLPGPGGDTGTARGHRAVPAPPHASLSLFLTILPQSPLKKNKNFIFQLFPSVLEFHGPLGCGNDVPTAGSQLGAASMEDGIARDAKFLQILGCLDTHPCLLPAPWDHPCRVWVGLCCSQGIFHPPSQPLAPLSPLLN